jgi:hypothetical protein
MVISNISTSIIATLLVILVSLDRGLGTAADASAQVAPTYHRMPCPAGAQPNLAQVSWAISNYKTHVSSSGHRTVERIQRVRRVYHAICGLTLVNPLVIPCVGNPSGLIARYNVAFFRRSNGAGRTLVRVTERRNGCFTLSVDNRRGLGAAGLPGPGLLIP